MTHDQFTALVALTSLRNTAALDCARMVLVDGAQASVAADSAGVSRQQVSNVLTKLRKTLDMAQMACGVAP